MDLFRRSVALYGRFSPGTRERLQQEIVERGGTVVRDLTRRSDFLVVGAYATALIDSFSLASRLQTATTRGVPFFGERAFGSAIRGEAGEEPTMPLSRALAPTALTPEDARLLAAFDLIVLKNDHCRFADVGVIRTAAELLSQNRSRAEVVRIMMRARDHAPSGRRKIVLVPSGDAGLQWETGFTTLEGQGLLPLDNAPANLEEIFEDAELAEAGGAHDIAARLYETCAQADRDDAIAPFNLGNIRLAQGKHDEASLAYARALARDADFVEARYNLSIVHEAQKRPKQAKEELRRVLELDPAYADAVFNLAQLLLKTGELSGAKVLYERYLTLDPPAEWAATARKAITYCAAKLSA
ncbi:MAG: tetratricopeptide repeat protein [Proteobacteria bacterium]|nr:tetratricopeptide repeat protein [Pseudomonadota bacterium]